MKIAERLVKELTAILDAPHSVMSEEEKQSRIFANIAVTLGGIADILLTMCGDSDED